MFVGPSTNHPVQVVRTPPNLDNCVLSSVTFNGCILSLSIINLYGFQDQSHLYRFTIYIYNDL